MTVAHNGQKAIATEEAMDATADQASVDLMRLSQEARAAIWFQFVERPQNVLDRLCERFQRCIAELSAMSGNVSPLAPNLREGVDALELTDDEYGVWGKSDGRGFVIRLGEPMDFHSITKNGYVVRVDSSDDAVRYENVATQTIRFAPWDGMYPLHRVLNWACNEGSIDAPE